MAKGFRKDGSKLGFQNGQKGELHPRWKGPETKKKYQKEYLRRLRMMALEALGGRCNNCSFEDPRALQIDHINGGGSLERKKRSFTGNFHKHVISSVLNGENKYQLLCANCNWIKRFENGEVR